MVEGETLDFDGDAGEHSGDAVRHNEGVELFAYFLDGLEPYGIHADYDVLVITAAVRVRSVGAD